MPEIDLLIGKMVERSAERMVLSGGQPARMYARGGEAPGPIIAPDRLQAWLIEIMPPFLQPKLAQEGRVQFSYSSTSGPVNVSVVQDVAQLHLEVTMPARVQPPQTDFSSWQATGQSAVSEVSALGYSAAPPIPPPIPYPVAGGAATRPLQSVGCLPVLGAMVLCLIGLVVVAAVLGNWSSYLIVLGTSIGVLVDAQGTERGRVKGLLDMSPWGWFFTCLLLWLVAFPCYLVTRPIIKKAVVQQ